MIELVIFDRDDTLNIDVAFTYKQTDLQLVPKSRELVDYIKEIPARIAVATNQSGIGEGYYTEEDMHIFNKALFDKLGLEYANNAVAFCPHGRFDSPRCHCRKPSPFLLLKLCARFGISPERTLFIGDADTDEQAALRAGCYFLKCSPLEGHAQTIQSLEHILRAN